MTTSLDASKAVINEELLRRIAREIMDKTEMTEDDLRKILRGSVSYIEDEALLYAHNRARRFEMLPGFKELLYAHRMVEASFNARSNVDRAQSFETLPGFEEELSKTGPIFALQMRKQIAKQIGERLGIPIDYQGVDEIPLRQLKKGARVRIRGDSEYAHQTSGIGTMLNDFGEEGINSEGKWAKVEFDNGYRDRYRKRDLELARKLTNAEIRALEKKNEGVLERVKTQTFAQFLQEMERQVTQAIKSDKAVGSLGDLALGSMGEFQPGDKIRMNWKANGRYSITKEGNYSITKEGSEGVVLGHSGFGKYSVKFTKLTGAPEREGEEFAVETECMGHISLEEVARSRGGIEKLAESIVQEVAKEIVAVKREEYYRKTLIEARDRFADQLISELVRDGLLMKLDDGVYGVNVNRVFSLVGGNLAKAYANPKLYGSPDMFSPPSERKSHVLRLELTQGCDYNQCTYCGGYKGIPYREKSYEEFVAHYKEVKAVVGRYNIGGIRRVFIGGGNALSVDFKTLLKVVQFIEDEVEPRRIAIYGRADSILKKGRERLERLEEAGLGLIYWGVESGSQAVLNYVRKKVKADQMFRAGHIAYDADLQLSVMVMPGLGGMKHAESHIEQTAEFLNSVNIRFVTFMAVNPPKKSRYAQIMAQEMADGKNRPLTDREVVEQLKEILTRMEPGYQKVGMFGCGIDQVGRNPVRFNVAFDSDGKREALAVCKRYLKKATA